MNRVIILMMDSFGLGYTDDAQRFGDVGANTFGHIWQYFKGTLKLPHLAKRGLFHAASAARHPEYYQDILTHLAEPQSLWGYAEERSNGKDTPSGHWEMAGVPVLFDWGYFPPQFPSFPQELIANLCEQANLSGVLGNCAASGTEIIEALGEEHIKTGKPIIYTSADSVFQIAAHETHFGLTRLYQLCEIARKLVDEYNIGRVIARPFIGEAKGAFTRTANRKDYATLPPHPTLLDYVKEAGMEVISVGKIADIYAHQGFTQKIKAPNNQSLFQATIDLMDQLKTSGIIFTNFVDFDSLYGHRRNIEGYGKALEDFDLMMPLLDAKLQPGDIVILTADHGCDPTFPGSDHTREHVPVICYGPGLNGRIGPLGKRKTFADIGQTIASFLGVRALEYGKSFL